MFSLGTLRQQTIPFSLILKEIKLSKYICNTLVKVTSDGFCIRMSSIVSKDRCLVCDVCSTASRHVSHALQVSDERQNEATVKVFSLYFISKSSSRHGEYDGESTGWWQNIQHGSASRISLGGLNFNKICALLRAQWFTNRLFWWCE